MGLIELEKENKMRNAAGDKFCDKYIKQELQKEGIKIMPFEQNKREVPATIKGKLGSWTFERAWYYWVAYGEPLSFELADILHNTHGESVRVAGFAGGTAPRDWYNRPYHKGVDRYNVDTQAGLNLLVSIIHQSEGVFLNTWRWRAIAFTLIFMIIACAS